jgi:tRNA(Ile)-lysidine synthase
VGAGPPQLRPATLGGVRIAPAGRLGPGWLLLREPACLAPPVPAGRGVLWDERFVLEGTPPPEQWFGALGPEAKLFRKTHNLPASLARTLPCLRDLAGTVTFPVAVKFAPPVPATSHPFFD